MDANNVVLITSILELAIKYGAPAILSAIQNMDKDVITVDDVASLALMVKEPKEYF